MRGEEVSKSPIHFDNNVVVLVQGAVSSNEEKTTTTADLESQQHVKVEYSHNIFAAFKLALLWSISEGESFISPIVAACLLGYIGGVVEAFRSRTRAYIGNQKDLVNASAYIQRIRTTNPSIVETVHCFHYETRTRSVPYTETTSRSVYRNGQYTTEYSYTTKYRTETYQELVTRHRDSQQIQYESCRDNSVVPDLSTYSICKLSATKCWATTRDSKGVYEAVNRGFQAKHANCDTYRTFGTEFNINGFNDCLLTYTSEHEVPFVVRYSECLFPVFAFTSTSWFFRVYLSGICGTQSIVFSKEVKVVAV
eukprot:gene35133-45481_t